MLHPVGELPPTVYWRRRAFFLALPLFLFIIVIYTVFSGGGGGGGGGGGSTAAVATRSTGSSTQSSAVPTPPLSAVAASPPPTKASSSTPSAPSSSADRSSATKTGDEPDCQIKDLDVRAAASSSKFSAHSRPTLYLQVRNPTKQPCRQDLADKEVELRIYSGDARIWGSHDCQISPGKSVSTLLPGVSVRRGIIWSGLTSAPKCAGTRIYPHAGTYQLRVYLAGHAGKALSFTLTS